MALPGIIYIPLLLGKKAHPWLEWFEARDDGAKAKSSFNFGATFGLFDINFLPSFA